MVQAGCAFDPIELFGRWPVLLYLTTCYFADSRTGTPHTHTHTQGNHYRADRFTCLPQAWCDECDSLRFLRCADHVSAAAPADGDEIGRLMRD